VLESGSLEELMIGGKWRGKHNLLSHGAGGGGGGVYYQRQLEEEEEAIEDEQLISVYCKGGDVLFTRDV